MAGYLSIHKCSESLLLKWTPNPMMSGESGTEKSQYWNRVLTVDMSDIVFLHCHQSGKILLEISQILGYWLLLNHRIILCSKYSLHCLMGQGDVTVNKTVTSMTYPARP